MPVELRTKEHVTAITSKPRATAVVFRKPESTMVPDWKELAKEANNDLLIGTMSHGIFRHLSAFLRNDINTRDMLGDILKPRSDEVIADMPISFAVKELAKRMSLRNDPNGITPADENVFRVDQIEQIGRVFTTIKQFSDLLPEPWAPGLRELQLETMYTLGEIQGETNPKD